MAHASRLVVVAAVQPEVNEEICDERDLEPASCLRLLPGVDLELVVSGLWQRVDQEVDILWSVSLRYEGQQRALGLRTSN